jgi:hypothetical protein
VIPEGQYVDTGREQRVRELGRDAEAVRDVLAVGDDEVEVELLTQARQALLDRTATGASVDVGDEEEPQGIARLAAGWSSAETWFPESCV